MKIIITPVGYIGTNCYIVYDEATKEGIVIDPGDEGDRILSTIEKLGVQVKAIINTHGHGDHIGGNGELKEKLQVPLMISEEDAPMLTDPAKNLSSFMGKNLNKPAADSYLKEGTIITFGTSKLKVLRTPGHTKGSISLVGEGVCFVGDTLFAGSIGRTDLPGGDYKEIIKSIKEKLLTLDEKVVVYPGHGHSTTISREKTGNPFLI